MCSSVSRTEENAPSMLRKTVVVEQKSATPSNNRGLRFFQNGGGGGDRTQFREIATPRRKAAQSTRSQCRIRRYRAQSKTANRSLTQFPCTRITLLRTICVQHACNRSTACLRTFRLSSRPGRAWPHQSGEPSWQSCRIADQFFRGATGARSSVRLRLERRGAPPNALLRRVIPFRGSDSPHCN